MARFFTMFDSDMDVVRRTVINLKKRWPDEPVTVKFIYDHALDLPQDYLQYSVSAEFASRPTYFDSKSDALLNALALIHQGKSVTVFELTRSGCELIWDNRFLFSTIDEIVNQYHGDKLIDETN